MKKLIYLFLTLVFVSQYTIAQVPSYVPTDGLVGYWPFDGNANDVSGNGNNGTVNGATLISDRFGNANSAYSFDGINDFIDISNTIGLISSQGLSLSIWTKNYNSNSNSSSNQQYLFLIGNNPNARILMLDESNQVSGSILNCNCVDDLYSSGTLNPNQWTHLILTYNLEIGEQKLYINGVNVDTKTESMTTYYTTNSSAKRIGSYWSNDHYFNGYLDDASIWNRPLTQEEITTLYESEVLSTNTANYESNINIYPNPANDHITIDFGNIGNVEDWDIKIINILGQEVLSQPMNADKINVSELSKGVYIIRISDGVNQTDKKFIKN